MMEINPAPSAAFPRPAYADYFQTASATPAALPPVAALLVVAALLPQELSLQISNMFLSMPRLLLLVAFVPLLFHLLQQAFRPGFHASLSDFALLPAALWMFLSVAMTQGVNRAVVGSSVLILEFVGAYLVSRTLPARPGAAVALARFAAGAIAVDALFGPLETLTSHHVAHDVVNLLTHNNYGWWLEFREGLLRAQGPQEHPILFGCVCCFGLFLAVSVLRGMPRLLVVGCCSAGLLSALSSAPIMCSLLGFGLLTYRRWTPRFKSRWWVLALVLAIFIGPVLMISSSPFGFIFQHFTLDPQTGWYRLLIWQVAGALVLANPLFGIGLDDWARANWMPSTVDSLWLRSAMEFGIVGSALIALVVIGSCSRAMRPARRMPLPAAEQSLGLALGIIVFLYIYLGFTVHFWGCTWILLGLFAGLRAHLGALAASQPQPDRLLAGAATRGNFLACAESLSNPKL